MKKWLKKIVERVTDNGIIYLLGISVLIILIIFIIEVYDKNKFDKNNSRIAFDYEIIQKTENLLSLLHQTESAQRSYLLTGDEVALEPFHESRNQVYGAIESLRELISENLAQIERIDRITEQTNQIFSEYANSIELRRTGGPESSLLLVSLGSGKEKLVELKALIKDIKGAEMNDIANLRATIEHDSRISSITMWITNIFNLIIIVIAIFAIRREKRGRIRIFTELDQRNREFLFNSGTQTKSKSEIEAVDNLITNLKIATNFIKEIGSGNYEYQYEGLNENNQQLNKSNLAGELLYMRELMRKATEDEKHRKIEDEKRNWATQGLAKFGDILRQNSDDIEYVSYNIIKNLVYYLKANQGGLFIINEEKQPPLLDLTAAFAFDRRKYLQKSIRLKEGLVGTCAVERETIYMTQIPDNYIEITSGMGGANPKCLLLVPLNLEDKILGVIEIASFNFFEKHEIEFVEQLAENIATTISATKINAKTAQLLEQSRKQAEELATQEQEMRQNLEELQATQAESARKDAEIRGTLDTINETLGAIDYDLDGNIIDANDFILQRLNLSKENVVGKHFYDFITDRESGAAKYKNLWDELNKGNTRKIERKYPHETEEIWMRETYRPMRDAKGEIKKVLAILIDTTEAKQQKKELREQQKLVKEKERELKISMKELKTAQDAVSKKQKDIDDINIKLAGNQAIIDQALNTAKEKEAELKSKNILFAEKEEYFRQNSEQQEFLKRQMELEIKELKHLASKLEEQIKKQEEEIKRLRN